LELIVWSRTAAALVAALVVAATAAGARADTLPTVPFAMSVVPFVTDGYRYAAYGPDAHTTRIVDTLTGSSFDVPNPDGCSSPTAIGGGQLLWDCNQMLDLATRTVHRPAGLDALSDEFTGDTLDVVLISAGSEWLEGQVDGAHGESGFFFLDWRTGERRDRRLGRAEVANLDSPTLTQRICSPLRRGTQAYAIGEGDTLPGLATAWYARPYLVTYDGRSELPNLYLERCGSMRRAKLARSRDVVRDPQLGAGFLTWTSYRGGRPRAFAYFPDGGRKLSLGPGIPLHTADRIFVSTARPTGLWTIRATSRPLMGRGLPAAHGLAPVSPMRPF
jgi:hypothetical protein